MLKRGSATRQAASSRMVPGWRISALVALGLTAGSITAEPISLKFIERNVDFTSAGACGVGSTGNATITVTGVSGPVRRAYMLWHGISSTEYANQSVLVNNNAVTGSSLGDATTNCWGDGSSRAFIADVTALVTGNGVYNVTNLANGSSFSANGASIIVAFDDGNVTNDRDLVIFGGNDSNFADGFPGESDGWAATLPGIPFTGGSVFAEFHCSDGQTPASDGTLALNTGDLSITIPDTEGLWDGTSLPDMLNGRNGLGLYDIHRFDISSIFGDPGDYTINLSGQADAGDCLGLVAMILDLRGGSAPLIPEISKTGPSRAAFGQNITYTILVENPTPVALPGAVVTDEVPPGTQFVSATNGGTVDNGIITWSLGDVAAQSTTSVSFTVQIVDSMIGSILNDDYTLTATGLPGEVTGPPVSTLVLAGVTFEFPQGEPEDWYFVSAAPDRSVPNNDRITSAPGFLRLQAVDNTNCFGFWESPLLRRVTRAVDPARQTTPIEVFIPPATGMMVARWRFFSDQSNAEVPQIRARLTDMDFQQTDMLVISSQGYGEFSPSTGGKDYAMLVWPNTGSTDFRLEFDLLNFDGDAPNGIVDFDFVNLRGLENSEVPQLTSMATVTFDQGTNWTPVTTQAYDAPAFSQTTLGDDGVLVLNPNGSSTCFGYWDSVNPVVTMNAARSYYVRFRVSSDATAENRAGVPSFRLRLNDTTLQGAAHTRLTSTGSANRVPVAGQPIDYYVAFQPDLIMDGEGLLIAFDMMNFIPSDSTNTNIYLHEVEVLESNSRF